MAARRIRDRRCAPGDGVAHGTGKRSTAAAGAAARATFPHRRAGRHPSPGPPPPDESAATGPPDLQQTLSVLIVRQWAETLTGEFDWGDWPLARYRFSEAFPNGLERQTDSETVAWICAMVACGLADELVELNLQHRTHRSSGVELVRHDAAHGYRCSVLAGRGVGSHLDFWRVPSGVIEFDRFMALRLVDSTDADPGAGSTAC